jgi:hypothetical protein
LDLGTLGTGEALESHCEDGKIWKNMGKMEKVRENQCHKHPYTI